MALFKKKQVEEEKTAREVDKIRREGLRDKPQKSKPVKVKRKIKKTVQQTIPYENAASEYIFLVKSGVKFDKQTTNLYSKTYLVPDINYSSATYDEKETLLELYIDLLNGFDSTADIQVTIHNTQINQKDFESRILLAPRDDGLSTQRDEMNKILHDKLMLGQNGIQCRKYLTVTISAIDFDVATVRFLNYEAHLNAVLKKMETELTVLKANERIRLLADIFRDVNAEITPLTREEFIRGAEKQHCCPTYFDFRPTDYFTFDKKYARCMFFEKLPNSIRDTIFRDLCETNLSIIISKNISFVEPDEALKLLRKQLTDMRMEEMQKVKKASERSSGAFVDPIKGTALAENMEQAEEFQKDLQSRNQKMTLVNFIIMVTADSFSELEANTEKLEIICRKNQIKVNRAPFRQEQCLASVLPLGNAQLKVRRTLSSESTAIFVPFNARELTHPGGLYYGLNRMTQNVIVFDRRKLNNPNGFILGVPGSGKSFAAKMEMIQSILATTDEILIVDPEREYTALAEMFGGEVIYISENAKTHLNPLDLTENPDKTDNEYDPIKAKYDFFLSFFSTILGNVELEPLQKTVIDVCLRKVYQEYVKKAPTLKEYYEVLERYEKENAGESSRTAAYLRQALHLYVHGSMNIFSNTTNVNINKRIVVYDIKELGKNMQSLGMMIVLENLWDKVAKNRSKGLGTRIYIDEMYLLFKSEQSATFFYELYKRARKWGGIPTGITQNVEDLLRSDNARSMLANTEFVLMLNQNATDREKLSELLKISPETMSYVTRADSGSGLIYAGKFGVIPFYNPFPSDTNLYSIMTTRFGENLEKLKAKTTKDKSVVVVKSEVSDEKTEDKS